MIVCACCGVCGGGPAVTCLCGYFSLSPVDVEEASCCQQYMRQGGVVVVGEGDVGK